MYSRKDAEDWEVTANGLYIATRDYLVRRGFCCSNKCRNCPYINWQNCTSWEPLPAECIKRTRVSPKSIAAAYALLDYHEQQLQHCQPAEVPRHQAMIEHYNLLLERWNAKHRLN
ncbi:DUF5522 domain-containing protein [Dictyobacter arantiisoli]|uniref:Uncharacterized protein n=1 Tax=Dictyobacter arantiisoli TaxID=2014874 RepID=A0A5A5T5M6_9CHLR|nr:DUF5522 domain-containing protein [Dictyobacter arantiisoli]GCF06637.1 hypothetical protein KDI_02010 [Dictyobacter arantiisoli]